MLCGLKGRTQGNRSSTETISAWTLEDSNNHVLNMTLQIESKLPMYKLCKTYSPLTFFFGKNDTTLISFNLILNLATVL